ncbi:MAG: hypothetical protein AB7V23_00600, partial [Candidatus Nanopelagicales bacterium]
MAWIRVVLSGGIYDAVLLRELALQPTPEAVVIGQRRGITLRSPMVVVEAAVQFAITVPLCLLLWLMLQTQAGLPSPLATVLAIGPMLWPIGWSSRRVRVIDDRVRQYRFAFVTSTWPRREVRKVCADMGDVGWAHVPSLVVALELRNGTVVRLPTLSQWAITRGQRLRAERAVTTLASVIGVALDYDE